MLSTMARCGTDTGAESGGPLTGLWRRVFDACVVTALLLSQGVCIAAESRQQPGQPEPVLRVYQVNKTARSLGGAADQSTPEAIYAAEIRRLAITIKPPGGAESTAKVLLDATIKEVRIFKGSHAVVLVEADDARNGRIIHIFWADLRDGRWLKAGESLKYSMEEARIQFARACGGWVEKPARPPIADPEAHLARFVEFLKAGGKDPMQFVLEALAQHKLVIMGEVHHRSRYWEFNKSLVERKEFAETTGVIYLELPEQGQAFIDRFLAADEPRAQLVIDALREVR